MTILDYSELKTRVLRSVGSSERYNQLLSTLKEFFRDVINSPRRYEQITSINQLLRVLEIRDSLSPNNIEPLKEIASRLPNSRELLQGIRDYENHHIPAGFESYFASEKTKSTHDEPEPQVEPSFVTHNPPTGMSPFKRQRIMETIIEDIGVSWRDLARGLNIKEKIIDDLNENHRLLSQKAKCIMELHNKNAEENTWFFELCDALETCKRKELIRKLKKIVVMNR